MIELEKQEYDFDPFDDPEDEQGDGQVAQKPRFVVDDDGKADWCIRKMQEADAEVARWEEHFAHQLERIRGNAERKRDWFRHQLMVYFQSVPHKATKTQSSYQLPSGKLVLKFPGPKYDAKDAAFIDWLKGNGYGEYVEVKESAKWGDFKKTLPKGEDGNLRTVGMLDGTLALVTEDGEIIPGVTVTPQEPEFEVKVSK